MRLWTRSIQPPDITPNPNDPVEAAPGTVGPPSATPGDPNGVVLEGFGGTSSPPPRIIPSAWSGWPSSWWPPNWGGRFQQLTDTAWNCVDLNASILATMPPYLVDAAPTLDSDWLRNPDPDIYTSWEEFAKQLFWDYQLGEAFVLATARYATGWPARFHVVPPWYVNVEMDAGTRRYSIGSLEVSTDILHIRYASSVDDAHGHGPLEAGVARLLAADVLSRYASGIASNGGIPSSVLSHPDELSREQSDELKAQWIEARLSNLGAPAVLSGGIKWEPTQLNPKDMALVELSQMNESRIAVLLGVPPFLVGLPSGGDAMTYSNVTALFDYHWRAGLRPKAVSVTSALSQWLTPRGTSLLIDADAYVQPEPLQRAQTEQIYLQAGVLSIDEVRAAEHFESDTRIEGVAQ